MKELSIEVTLTADTLYRAVAIPIQITELKINKYTLGSSGDSWYMYVDTSLDRVLKTYTQLTYKLYEGDTVDEEKLLGTYEPTSINTIRGGEQSVTNSKLKWSVRPSDCLGKVLLV